MDDLSAWIAEYEGGQSLSQISAKWGAPYSRVRGKLIVAGVKMRDRTEAMKASLHRRAYPKHRPPLTDAHKEKIRQAKLAHAEKYAKGVSLKPNGYFEHTRGPNKGRGVHRTQMEERLGRRLDSKELVHHDDENRSNNSDENLEVMSRSEHARLHALRNLHKRKRDENGRFT